jgi:phage protein D
MVKKPSFKLISDNKDVTAIIAKNLMSLTYEDKAGEEADEISFTVNGLYEKKPFGTSLELWLGYVNNLYLCGSFTIQTINKDYKAQTTEVRATSVNFAGEQTVRKQRTWGEGEAGTNLYDITKKIAEDNKLDFSAPESAKNISVISVLQNNESDLAFLITLCEKNGYILAVKNNSIEIKEIGGTTAETKKESKIIIPDHKLKTSDLSALRTNEANRDVYIYVIVGWQGTDGQTHTITVGDTNVEKYYFMEIPEPKSKTEALQVAKAKLLELTNTGMEGSFSAPGQNIKTNETVEIENVGKFVIKNVTHSITTTDYVINVDFFAA